MEHRQMSWWKRFLKENVKKRMVTLIVLIAFLTFGFLLVFYSWDGKIYVSLGKGKYSRGLAEEGESDSSVIALSKEDLGKKGANQLFSKSKTNRTGLFLKFYLGNFIISDKTQGKRLFVCQLYDYVELTFKGLDSEVSKNTGGMVFKAPCLMEEEEFIGPFYFPLSDVLSQSDLQSNKMEFTLPDKNTLVRFHTMAPAMNNNWLLIVARFFNSSNADEDGFFVHFTPGEDAPYFELQFRE